MNMNDPDDKTMRHLRQRAEAIMAGQPEPVTELEEISTGEMRRLFHELDVYRVELEMQNEELRKTQDELEEALDKYTDLYEYAPVGYLIVQQYGIITSANITACTILDEDKKELIGTSIQTYVTRDYQDAFYMLRRSSEKKAGVQSCEIAMKRRGESPFRARMDCIAIPGEDDATAFRISFSDIDALTTLD